MTDLGLRTGRVDASSAFFFVGSILEGGGLIGGGGGSGEHLLAEYGIGFEAIDRFA